MNLKFSHVRGYSSVDHFGPELVSLCEQIAASKPKADGLRNHVDHTIDDYRKMVAHGRAIIAEARSRFQPCVDYDGPTINSIRISVSVTTDWSSGNSFPPQVTEKDEAVLREYINQYKKATAATVSKWRAEWIRSHPECCLEN